MQKQIERIWQLLFDIYCDNNVQVSWFGNSWGYFADGEANEGWDSLDELEEYLEETKESNV